MIAFACHCVPHRPWISSHADELAGWVAVAPVGLSLWTDPPAHSKVGRVPSSVDLIQVLHWNRGPAHHTVVFASVSLLGVAWPTILRCRVWSCMQGNLLAVQGVHPGRLLGFSPCPACCSALLFPRPRCWRFTAAGTPCGPIMRCWRTSCRSRRCILPNAEMGAASLAGLLKGGARGGGDKSHKQHCRVPQSSCLSNMACRFNKAC